MFFIEIIAVIVIAFVMSKLSSRLKKVEDELKSINGQRKVSEPQVNTTNVPLATVTNTATSNIDQNYSQPTESYSASVAQNNSKLDPQVSSEENSGRILGGIGITAVVVGISFFLKYAFDNNWIGPSGRVMIGITVGITLLIIGQYLRNKYIKYSDLLMGGGIGVLYLSIFAAHAYYSLISPSTAGIFMFIITALTFAISITNATITLAFVGAIGGFITPLLINTGNNSMLELFSYLTILNLGIMSVSFFKKWPALIAVAFVGTLYNFSGWFQNFYHQSDFLMPTLIFCFVTFLIFLVSAVARATVTKAINDGLNYFLLGGNAMAIAIMSYILLKPDYHGVLGYVSVFIAIIYMAVAFIVNKYNANDKALNIFLPGLAVTFLSVAVPLQFSGAWIAVSWIIESAFLYGIASVISSRGFQVMGLFVYCIGIFNLFIFNFPKNNAQNFVMFVNEHFSTVILAVIVAYAIAYMYYKFGSLTTEVQKRAIVLFVIIANVLTVYAFSSQIIFYNDTKTEVLNQQFSATEKEASLYNTGYDTSSQRSDSYNRYYAEKESITNQSNTYVSILWILYAAVLTIVGFGKRIVTARRLSLVLFAITALKVFIDVWSLGQIYRIVSFIVLGVVALGASFFYVKFKDRLSEIV